MNTLKNRTDEARELFLSSPNQITRKTYLKLAKELEAQERETKLNEFKQSIEAKNRYYILINELAPKVCEVLNSYKETFSTTNGSIRQSLFKLLPKHENINYYVRSFGSNISDNLEINFRDGNKNLENYTVYKRDGIYYHTPFELINFDKEYKQALKYLKAYQKAVKELEAIKKPHVLIKEFIKHSNKETNEIRF